MHKRVLVVIFVGLSDLEGRGITTVVRGTNMKKVMIKVPLMCHLFKFLVLFSRKGEKLCCAAHLWATPF